MYWELRSARAMSWAAIVAAIFCGPVLVGYSTAEQNEDVVTPGKSPIRIEPVTDIWPGKGGSAPGNAVVFRGTVYFRAHNKADGSDIWRFDGDRTEIAIEGNLPAFDYGLRVEVVF